MKLKDIQVGVDYAVGSEEFCGRATVLEKGLKRHVQTGARWDYHGHTSSRADSVKVRWVDGPGRAVRETLEAPQRFLRTWAEQEPIQTAKADAAAERQGREARVKKLVKALTAAGVKCREGYRSGRQPSGC